MKTMWVDKRVEATVEFPRGLTFPRLRAIRFRAKRVVFPGPVQVDRTSSALVYCARAGTSEYTIRFESALQRWVLGVVRDGALPR